MGLFTRKVTYINHASCIILINNNIPEEKNVTNEVQDLYIKNNKILLKKVIEDLSSKNKDIPLYGLDDNDDNNVTMTTISKLMYRINDVLIKILIFFTEIVKLILRFIRKYKSSRTAKIILRKKNKVLEFTL